MNEQVYNDYQSYVRWSGLYPTYCNVYFDDVFRDTYELPDGSASRELTEAELQEFFSSRFPDDMDELRATFHEQFDIVHIVEEADRLTNAEDFWECCGWKFGNLADSLSSDLLAKVRGY